MKKCIFGFLVFLVISMSSVGFSYVPPETNADDFWVSEEASDFWVMNNPEGRIKNEPAVFHYNSSHDLVEKVYPEETSIDFVGLDDGRWIGVSNNEIKIYDKSWNIIRSKKVEFKGSLNNLNKVRKHGENIEVLAEINGSYYSYKIILEDLDLEKKALANPIEPNKSSPIVNGSYSPKADRWLNNGAIFKIKNETEKLEDNSTFVRRNPVYVNDIQVVNDSAYFLTSKPHSGIGGKIYQYDLEIENEKSSFNVGLTESEIDKSFSTNFIGILAIFFGLTFLGFVFLAIFLIYTAKKED